MQARERSAGTWLWVAVLFLGGLAHPGHAQAPPDPDVMSAKLASGVMIATDPEIEGLFAQAIATGVRPAKALPILQKVMDEGQQVYLAENGRFVRASRVAEDTIRHLPPGALKLYRLTADAQCKDLLGDVEGCRDESLLLEAGERLDLGDYANWANARIVREP